MFYSLPLVSTNAVSPLIKDYLNQDAKVQPLYSKAISYESILKNANQKTEAQREMLYNILQKQHKDWELSSAQKCNLELLKKENSFTITTGHQLNFLSGPVFFIYKIAQTIKLCKELNEKQNNQKYIPIFWLASEDHDFKEINHFHYKNQTIEWQTDEKGAVGNFATTEMHKVLEQFIKENPNLTELKTSTEQYLKNHSNKNLSHFTRNLVQNWFKEYGILVLDANEPLLKKQFIPYFLDEINNNTAHKYITQTNEYITQNQYNIQVKPREINLFYLDQNGRNRIEKQNQYYYIINTPKKFTEEEIQNEIHQFPERFSPNALLRPLYQEVLLPNSAYIGGNAEIAYWLQLKNYFDAQKVQFPVLIPRNSFFVFTNKNRKKMNEFHWEIENLFQNKNQILQSYLKENFKTNIPFEEHQKTIENLYISMKNEAIKTDKTFLNLLNAQQTKQLNAFRKLEKRLWKAEKKLQQEKINKFENLQQSLFPDEQWQERKYNLYHFAKNNTTQFIATIYKSINTISPNIICIIFD